MFMFILVERNTSYCMFLVKRSEYGVYLSGVHLRLPGVSLADVSCLFVAQGPAAAGGQHSAPSAHSLL